MIPANGSEMSSAGRGTAFHLQQNGFAILHSS
jgi:hypothetical protein